MKHELLAGFAVLNHNAVLCKNACDFLEDFLQGEGSHVWIEKPNGEIIMLEKDWKIKTAEILPF